MFDIMKIKIGFSFRSQLRFAIALNNETIKNPNQMIFDTIKHFYLKRTHLAAVMISRMQNGETFEEATRSTFNPVIAGYILAPPALINYNTDMLNVLLCHSSVVFRVKVMAALLTAAMIAMIYCDAISAYLPVSALIVFYIIKPLVDLHAGKLD